MLRATLPSAAPHSASRLPRVMDACLTSSSSASAALLSTAAAPVGSCPWVPQDQQSKKWSLAGYRPQGTAPVTD